DAVGGSAENRVLEVHARLCELRLELRDGGARDARPVLLDVQLLRGHDAVTAERAVSPELGLGEIEVRAGDGELRLRACRRRAIVAVVELDERVATMHRLTLLDEVALDPPGDADADRHVAVACLDVARAGEDGRGTGLSRRGDGGI